MPRHLVRGTGRRSLGESGPGPLVGPVQSQQQQASSQGLQAMAAPQGRLQAE
ncbi:MULTISPECIES: hypothetical protein [Variovorax]|uniref:hypothetical protein n=1 Tax=Variovorax TaxID=34072 RepID=UPI0003828613|nr:hypothetical protein [Variovorax paradoxus]MBW8718239.1 hypothetical protein [Variovorax paradoxus]